jgi:hypothetical protein
MFSRIHLKRAFQITTKTSHIYNKSLQRHFSISLRLQQVNTTANFSEQQKNQHDTSQEPKTHFGFKSVPESMKETLGE